MTSRIVICPICNEEVIAKGMLIDWHFRTALVNYYNRPDGYEHIRCNGSERIISNDEMPKLSE